MVFAELARKHDLPGIFYIDIWPAGNAFCVITDPKLQDEVTVVHPQPISPLADQFLRPILGPRVISTAVGDVWKKVHAGMAPAFSWNSIRGVTGLMVDEGITFRKALDNKAKTGETFSMESLAGLLFFEITTRIVFNTTLDAQTKGSLYLDNLLEMVSLAEGELDLSTRINPWKQIYRRWRRSKVLSMLHPRIKKTITDRYNLLKADKIVPSRKNPYSLLDLMLREYLQEQAVDGEDQLPDEELQMLLGK